MKRGIFRTLFAALLFLAALRPLCGQPAPRAIARFDAYANGVESRLALQHQSRGAFLAPVAQDPIDATARLKSGELMVERLTPSAGTEISGSLLHHWRGTAFVAGAKPADFVRLMQDFTAYPQRFSPQVLRARLIARNGDRLQASMRIRQKHVITVVLDTAYDITYGRLDAQHGYSISRSTQVSEIHAPGTPDERTLSPEQEQGFLWRLNTYWSYEEKDGGLYLQIEAVSLTRSIPFGLGWAIRPYIESIPRESLEFTLRSVCKALAPPAMSAAIERTER